MEQRKDRSGAFDLPVIGHPKKPKVFLSYSDKDRRRYDIAGKVGLPKKAQRNRWVETEERFWFFAPHSLRHGDELRTTIQAAIRESDEFRLFWSKNARDSEWIAQELIWAGERKEQIDQEKLCSGPSSQFSADPQPHSVPYYRIYRLDDCDLGVLNEGLGGEFLAEDLRPKTEWPKETLSAIAVFVVGMLAEAVLATFVSPGQYAHVVFYITLTLVGAIFSRYLWSLGEYARSLVSCHVTALGLFDLIAWLRLPGFPHTGCLQAVDMSAYAFFGFCIGLMLLSPFKYSVDWVGRWIRSVSLSALMLCAYSVSVCLYWYCVAVTPESAGIDGAFEEGWSPNAKQAEGLLSTLHLPTGIGGQDDPSALIAIYLYLLLGLVALVIALIHRRSGDSAEAEMRGWGHAALLMPIPPSIYLLLGPWQQGGLLYLGEGLLPRLPIALGYLAVSWWVYVRYLWRQTPGPLPG